MTWIQELTKSTSELESPASFWYWAGLVTISAVVKDNVWLNRGGAYNLYPNIYCILHAESGLKKGPPISLAKDLVRLVNNTKIISGRSSIQGILSSLSKVETKPGGIVTNKSAGFICSSELSSSIVEDNAALTILTDLYDRHYNPGEWSSLLKSESFQLKDPTVCLLGGINDAHAEEFFGKKDIQGGFLARTFVIYEKEEQTINSLMQKLTIPIDREGLSVYLKELSKVKGPFKDTFDDNNDLTPVGRFYDEWYHAFRAQVKQMEVKDETGTLNRFGDSVLKVAMLLSLARSTDLEITIQDMENAISTCEKLVGNIRQTTMGRKGLSSSSTLKTMIIMELLNRENHTISRVVLSKKMWMHYTDITEFDNLMLSFEAAGLIKIAAMGGQTIYTMVKEEAEKIKNYLKGKNK
jgi:hypothetical protein